MEMAKDSRSNEVRFGDSEWVVGTCCVVCENGKVLVEACCHMVERRRSSWRRRMDSSRNLRIMHDSVCDFIRSWIHWIVARWRRKWCTWCPMWRRRWNRFDRYSLLHRHNHSSKWDRKMILKSLWTVWMIWRRMSKSVQFLGVTHRKWMDCCSPKKRSLTHPIWTRSMRVLQRMRQRRISCQVCQYPLPRPRRWWNRSQNL